MFNIFPYVFTNTFNALVNNRELIDNIVDSVLNSEVMGDLINNLDSVVNPTIEFNEHNEAYVIEAYLPGVQKSDIDIDYENNYITVEIKRNFAYSNNNGNMSVAVIQQGGSIVKDFYVEGIDPYKIKAVFKEEKLRVLIPKNTYKNTDAAIIDVDEYIVEE